MNHADGPEMHQSRDSDDWLVQLIHAPIGGVVTSGDRGAVVEHDTEPSETGVAATPAPEASSPATGDASPDAGDAIRAVPLDAIRPNPEQPRRSFDEGELQALAESIAAQGVIQPIMLRPIDDASGSYELVAGERRWRAARLAGLATIPAIVRPLSDARMSEVALVENIQRADLPPLDEAHAYQQLIDRHGLTQDEIARRLGRNRSHIAHMLRLQRLPESVQQMIRAEQLSVGHARVLVNAIDPEALARRVIAEGLTVRQTEEAAKAERAAPAMPSPAATPDPEAARDRQAWADRFGALLQRPVTVKAGRKGGSLVIHYDNDQDLASILAKIGG